MGEDTKILKEISHKLDQLIVLSKLTNREILETYRREIMSDPVYSKILEYADGSLNRVTLTEKVAKEASVAEITVKRRISRLGDMGFLVSRREGRDVYYENSGLFE
jgi:DNA-binding transcriptional ArsR family regulator